MHFITTAMSLLSVAVLAVATNPTTTTVTVTAPAPTSAPGECSTGPVQCCNNVEPVSGCGQTSNILSTDNVLPNPHTKANGLAASSLLGLLNIVVQPIDTVVGLGCSPITIIGAGQSACNANAVCCQNNNYVSARQKHVFERY